MSSQTLVALYNRQADALDAASELEAAGVDLGDISLIGPRGGESRSSDPMNSAAEDTAEGALIGAALGGSTGFLASLVVFALPGLGPVVAGGWLLTALGSAGLGASAGSLVGALAGAGISDTDAETYAEGVQRGIALLTVRTDEIGVPLVREILEAHDPLDPDEHETLWRQEGWSGPCRRQSPREQGAVQVGSRESEQGPVRVRAYTLVPSAEQPFAEPVVPVGPRSTGGSEEDLSKQLFRDRVVEAVEREEVPAVSRSTRVVDDASTSPAREVTDRT